MHRSFFAMVLLLLFLFVWLVEEHFVIHMTAVAVGDGVALCLAFYVLFAIYIQIFRCCYSKLKSA